MIKGIRGLFAIMGVKNMLLKGFEKEGLLKLNRKRIKVY